MSTPIKKGGSKSFTVRWRNPKSRSNQGLTAGTLFEAETFKRLLDANGQSFEIAQHGFLSNAKRTPTVSEVIQEHIHLLIRPSSGTIKTYQTMLDMPVRNVIGHVPVDKPCRRVRTRGALDNGFLAMTAMMHRLVRCAHLSRGFT